MSTESIGACCASPRILTKLTFPDGTQTSVVGLTEILAALHAEGRQVNGQTAEEILERVAAKNYIPSSARDEYRELLIKEYRKYVAVRENNERG